MSIPLTGTGGLFTRIGAEVAGINEASTSGTTANTRVGTILAQFASTDQKVTANLTTALASFLGTTNALVTEQFSEITQIIIQMAIDDGTGINPQTIQAALLKLKSQMSGASASINKPTVGQSVTPGGSNIGNGVLICSVIDGYDGLQADYALAETITATCTSDGYPQGGATAGNEPFNFVGQPQVAGTAWNWPQGSGVSKSINTVNALATGGLITDGDFENWSGSPLAPTSWLPIVVGTAGTTVSQSSSKYTGSFALQLTGTSGGENTEIKQQLSLTALQPSTVYGFCIFAKQDGSVAAGVLHFRLIDGSANQINDNAGNNVLVSLTCSSLTTSYAAVTGFFRTPSRLPAAVYFDIVASTPLTNAHSVFLDHLQVAPSTQLYTGGPYCNLFSGSTNFAKNDVFTLAITNSLGTTSFARSLDRTLGLGAMGPQYKIPSSGSPTVNDNLIA